jgi:DNA-binding FrmR family transcriptional regulator
MPVEPAPACGKPGTGIQATENALDSINAVILDTGLRRCDEALFNRLLDGKL